MPYERRPAHFIEVRLVIEDEVPVGHVAESGKRIAAKLRDLVRIEDNGYGKGAEQEREECRQQTPRPPEPELLQPDTARSLPAFEKDAGDQVAADHKEDFYTEKTTGYPPLTGMKEQDGCNRQCPQPVQTW